MLDLWQFDENTLKQAAQKLPNRILQEQAEVLSKKTQGFLYGRLTNVKFDPDGASSCYDLATVFDIVVPQLDNYSYTLLIVYSRPESDYPVAVTVEKTLVDDELSFAPQYECKDEASFIQALQEILSSSDVNRKIQILYAKARF